MAGVSIVMPTLNEAGCLGRTLRHLSVLDPSAAEVLIVDGGSTDETLTIVRHAEQTFPQTKIRILLTERCGRSLQMNRGAEAATGDILCFLHADTLVPDDLVTIVQETLTDPTVACGGFVSLMAGSRTTRWGVSLHNYLKTYYAPLIFRPHLFLKGFRLLFGDQVMFCRREDFWACSGFDAAMPIMEEADLCLKLVRRGRIRQINRVVQSCDRRVAKWGAFKATAIYLYIGLLWGIGVSPAYLKQFYEDVR